MTTDPNGWPDPARPGCPKNPERDGWHWLKHPEDLRPFPSPWNAELGGWPSGALHSPQGIIDLGFTYLGPCLTPAEVAAAVQAEREACASYCDSRRAAYENRASAAPNDTDALVAASMAACFESAADAIRARGPADALAEALAQARREGMEEAARVVSAAHDVEGACHETISMIVRAVCRAAAGEAGE